MHLTRFFVNGEVAFALEGVGIFFFLTDQLRDQLVNSDVHLGAVFSRTGDDQRSTRFIDQDGVNLIHQRIVQLALNSLFRTERHVVAQVVKAVFVVGTVSDVSAVGFLLLLARHVGQVDAHREAQEVVQPPHPLRIAVGEVVVHGHHVHTLARQSIEVHGQGGGEGLALARPHFGDLAKVQRHAPQQLHIKVPHLHDALGALAHHGKGFGQDVIQRFALGHALLELLRLGLELLVRQFLVVGLHRVDAGHRLAVLLEEPVVAAAE
ncbi:hypothetical protein D3C71_1151690 [compost metagenome]